MGLSSVRRMLIGDPFPTSWEARERLDKIRALAVFASDPISSNAYATEAIMSVLIILGSGALGMTLPLAMAVASLVLLVIFSYIQTILHYPDGGGAYTVSKDNLGRFPSLLAGGALLTDYILTVSVSSAAGVRAVTSAFPEVWEYRVWLALAAILVITWLNLRGVRESGTIFAFPTYAFVGGVLLVITIGLVRYFGLFGATPTQPQAVELEAEATITGFAFIWLLLRAFAGGTTALTGIEAISNGVQAFEPSESKNAAKTMVAMGAMATSAIVPIADVHRGSLRALTYAKRIASDVRVISIATTPEMRERLEQRWSRFPKLTAAIRFDIVDYDFRDVVDPLVDFIVQVSVEEFPGQLVTVVVPEFLPEAAWAGLLHNQTASILRRRLRTLEGLIIIEVPYHITVEKVT